MADNTFWGKALQTTAKSSPLSDNGQENSIGFAYLSAAYDSQTTSKLTWYEAKSGKLQVPRSIMNQNVGINYRNIFNGELKPGKDVSWTLLDDYKRMMSDEEKTIKFNKLKRNPTYQNIIDQYEAIDDGAGLCNYRMQDFIYLKYFNQIPNNYMVTLRRYARPIPDRMISFDYKSKARIEKQNFPKDGFCAIATAVTYMGEKAGNKMSEILKFDYGANWENKEATATEMQSSDGGLAAQLKLFGLNASSNGTKGDWLSDAITNSISTTAKSGPNIHVANTAYPGNAFIASYGQEFYGDINSINSTQMRARGLTFSNNFSLNFEYSLKSLKFVNPRVAMMDILSNFLLLTGNYGEFWGGETIFYGSKNIAPQFGDPQKLRDGHYGEYMNSLAKDIKGAFGNIKAKAKEENGTDSFASVLKTIGKAGFQGAIGNLLGGNIGEAGMAQAPPALLTGEPTGYWHIVIGNPMDPIAMMGNMVVKKTSVEFGDTLGYDDFPTEIKFTVEIEHGKPRDNANIENMFNGNKGRFYVLSKSMEESFALNYVKDGKVTGMKDSKSTQEVNQIMGKQVQNHTSENNATGTFTTGKLKVVGSMLQ